MWVVYVLIMYACWWSLLQLCFHVEVDEVLLGCVVMNACQLYMNLLCMSVSICCYAYIAMSMVVLHVVMVCSWYCLAW